MERRHHLSGGGSASLVNDGTIAATSTDSLTFAKTGSTGVTALVDSRLVNNGTIDVQSGTVALPRTFVNDGTRWGTGTYMVQGTTLANDGTIAPGNGGAAIGTLDLTGSYLQTASGRFAAQVGGTGIANLFAITRTAQRDGTLALSCFAGCGFANGDVFTLLDAVGRPSGAFGNVTTSGSLNGFASDVVYDNAASRVQLRVNSAGTTPPVTPATGAMMLLGFGSMGYAIRRSPTRTRLRIA